MAQSYVLKRPPQTPLYCTIRSVFVLVSFDPPTQNVQVASQYGRTHLDGCEGTYPSLAVGAVSEALDAVPYRATDSTHGERAAEIIENNPGAGVSGVIHFGCVDDVTRGLRRCFFDSC